MTKILFISLLVTVAIICSSISASVEQPTAQQLINLERSEQLSEEFQDFRNLISDDKLLKIITRHLLYDASFNRAVNYMHNNSHEQMNKFTAILKELPEYTALISYFRGYGFVFDVTVPEVMSRVEELFEDMPELPMPAHEAVASGRSVKTFMQDILNSIDKTEFSDLVQLKDATSAVFKDHHDAVRNVEFTMLMTRLLSSKTVREGLAMMKAMDIDVMSIMRTLSKFLTQTGYLSN